MDIEHDIAILQGLRDEMNGVWDADNRVIHQVPARTPEQIAALTRVIAFFQMPTDSNFDLATMLDVVHILTHPDDVAARNNEG